MKNKEVVAIASADWHIHKFRDFDINGSRLNYEIQAAREIFKIAGKYGVPLLFAGDLVHNPKNIETETNIRLQRLFTHLPMDFIAISGNHDFCERNTIESKSPSHLQSILRDKFYLLGEGHDYYSRNGLNVWGIPYMNNEGDLKSEIIRLKKPTSKIKGIKILLLHTDMPGAKTPEGFQIGELQNIPKDLDVFFKEWDLVLCGHIHKPQKLSKKCYMLGCPIQQNKGNRNDELGYWEVYSDATMKFIPLNNYPKFIQLKKGEKQKEDGNYYIAYEQILEEKEVITGEFNINLSKDKLAARYLAKKQIKSKSKKRALIKILNEE